MRKEGLLIDRETCKRGNSGEQGRSAPVKYNNIGDDGLPKYCPSSRPATSHISFFQSLSFGFFTFDGTA